MICNLCFSVTTACQRKLSLSMNNALAQDTKFNFCLKFFRWWYKPLCDKLSHFSQIPLEIIHGLPQLCRPWTKKQQPQEKPLACELKKTLLTSFNVI